MRLTNAARMSLPPGRLRLLTFPAIADGAALPISFDQRRHVGAGDRPGSWMAVAIRLDAPVSEERLASAWRAVIGRHGSLQTAFRDRADGPALHAVAFGPAAWHDLGEGGAAGLAAPSSRDVLRAAFDAHCRPFGRPAHALVVVESADPADPRPALVVGADHSLVDMWSMSVIVRDLLAVLDALDTGRAPGLAPAAAFVDHTRAFAAMPAPPADVIQRWGAILGAEGGVMPRFPMPLGDLGTPPPEVVEVRDVFDAAGFAAFESAAQAAGVRTTALAMSVLASATRELADRPLRAVFPIHSRTEAHWLDAVGWFVTNSVIEITDPSPAGATTAFREALRDGSVPLGPVFAPYGGMPQAPGMFAISWLDARRQPIVVDARHDLQHVSAVIRTDGVMIWFIANSTGLHLRCRYPDTPEARDSLGRWLDAVAAGFHRA